jgi:iron complex outermembrane receptor protein
MKKFVQLLFITTIFLFPQVLTGQNEIVIKGKIIDNSGTPLIDANVSIVDSSYGGSTDGNGDFVIELPGDYINKEIVLEVHYVGFITQYKSINLVTRTNVYDFELERDVLSIKPIIVTAQRREENLQNVPTSITTMDSEEMRKRGIERVFDLQNSIPNFYLGDGTFNFMNSSSIRGIAGASRASGVETRANYYVDDVYIGRSIAMDLDLFDLERIEILKGPQGTLFGKNTVSGVVNLTTRKPFNRWERAISVDAGNLGFLNNNIVFNTPLVESKLFARFSGRITRRDGYVKNIYHHTDMNGLNILTGRLQLRYIPSPNMDINLSIDAVRDRRDRRTAVEALQGPGYDVAPKPREIAHDVDEYEHRDIFGCSLNTLYQFPNNYSIKSITAYRKIDDWGTFDEDLSAEDLNWGEQVYNDIHFTQEIRLTSPLFEKFNFISGLFYFYQKAGLKFQVTGTPEASIPNMIFFSEGPVTTNSIAGYFHGNYNITGNLSIFGGIRYTYEYKKINWTQINGPDPFIIYLNIENYNDTYSKGVPSPQIGIQYKSLNQLMCYGKVTWGYKSGGWGNHTVQTIESLKLKPEYAVSYEAGIKLTTLDNRLSFNTAAFLSKFDDYQTEVWRSAPFGLVLPIYTNAAKVTSKGFEMELIASPLENLSLSASLGYVDAKYDEFTVASEYNYEGHRLELAPETEYNLSAEYKMPITNIGTFSVRGNFIHRDDFYWDANNEPDFLVKGYELIDGKIGYESYDGSFGIYVWGKNLLDKLYMLSRSIAPVGAPFAWYGMPRTFGVQITYNFLNTN